MKVSVLIRTFNSADTIERAVKSALAQNVDDVEVEVIVVDDGSEDETVAKAKGFDGVRVLGLPHLGSIRALNQGMRATGGDLVTILDGDDELPKKAMEKYFRGMNREGEVYWYGDYDEVAVNGKMKKVTTAGNIFNTLAGGLLFEKSTLAQVGWYDETLIFPEYDLLMKLMSRGYVGAHVKGSVYRYHRRKGSITDDKETVRRGVMQLEKRWGRKLNIRRY